MTIYSCVGCGGRISDDDRIVRPPGDLGYWHVNCFEVDQRRKRHPGASIGAAAGATKPSEFEVAYKQLMEPKMNEHDLQPDQWAKASAAAGAKPVDWAKCVPIDATIDYMITPKCFVLRIPVEALANLSADAHTRMLAMLNAWIVEHTPPKVKP